MDIRIDGKPLSEAVIRDQQMELRILSIAGDTIRFQVKAVYGDSFNFVPRFFRLRYSDGSEIPARNSETLVLEAGEVIEVEVVFEESPPFEPGSRIELRYGLGKLADLTVD